jgi:sulfur-oxidizing protein SoxZ
MGNPMKIRARADGDVVEVRVLMSHPMETGQRKDQAGDLIPAHFIQTVTITCQDRTVLSAQWGPAVSANPYVAFKFRGGQKGDKIRVAWVDSKGDSRSDEVAVA